MSEERIAGLLQAAGIAARLRMAAAGDVYAGAYERVVKAIMAEIEAALAPPAHQKDPTP